MKLYLPFFVISLFLGINSIAAQSKKRDLLFLKNGNRQAGEIINSDSNAFTIKTYDHSIIQYPWNEIDSVTGLSYRTHFFSFDIGINKLNYWSTFYYQKIQSTSNIIQLRYGLLRNNHRCRYIEFAAIAAKPFKARRLGYAERYYFNKGYTADKNIYIGAEANWTFIKKNADYISLGLHVGREFMFQKKYRLFLEFDLQNAIFSVDNNSSVSLTLGFRTGREYKTFYRNLNQNHQLP